jgi:hypothetical protein
MVEFARIWRDTPKIVYSRTLERAGWNTTIVREVVPSEVQQLKERTGGDLALGGADLAAAFHYRRRYRRCGCRLGAGHQLVRHTRQSDPGSDSGSPWTSRKSAGPPWVRTPAPGSRSRRPPLTVAAARAS